MAGTKEKFRNRGLQANIFFLFFITLCAVIFAAYYVKQNEQILRKTINELSKPEKELSLLHDILSYLPEAENKLRFFALTNDEKYFKQYELLINSVESNIKELNSSTTNDSLTIKKLDTVAALLQKRKELIISYLDMKKEQEQYNFADIAFRALKKRTPDSLVNKRKTSTTIITVYDTIPSEKKETDNVEATNKGFFSKLKEVFSKKPVPEVEMQIPDPIIRSTIKIQTDTSAITSNDTVMMDKIGKELSRIKRQDLINYTTLKDKELNMLQNSSLLIEQITDIFKRLEISIVTNNEIRASIARKNASKSLYFIGILSLIALVLIMILVVLIINSLRKSNRYRKELIEANIQANELAKVKEEFLANMSHEIRTPLNSIIGFSQLLSNTSLDHIQTKYTDAVRRSSKHLLETVNDILDLSRLAAGKFQIENVPFSLEEIFDDVIPLFQLQANEKGLEFNTLCNFDKSIVLEGDPLRLRQILYNLLSNALKFTIKGSISIDCNIIKQESQAILEVNVKDTGIGIPTDKNKSIFEDFQQAESTSARKYGGSGLGLAISRRLARLQDGDIKVQSEPGNGSTFNLVIKYPILANQTASSIKHDIGITEDEEYRLAGVKLLVVDDDSYNIMLVKIIGENHKMNIHLATDGYSAEEMLGIYNYDLAFTDLQMPGLTGIELIRYIREHKDTRISKLPVIAFTANKIDRFDEKLLALGFNEVLSKPFMEEEFLQIIASYINPDSPLARLAGKVSGATRLSETQTDKEFDLTQLQIFTGGNIDQTKNILLTFHTSAINSVKQLWQSFESGNYVEIKEIAHRMLTSYGQLKIGKSLAVLTRLEEADLNQIKSGQIKALIEELDALNKAVFPQIEQELERLKNEQ